MAVQEQTPIIEYIANGSTNIFPITFDIHSTEDLGVLINGELALEASYQVQDNSVVFMVLPPSGSAVTLFRDTEKNRLTDYKSYDNSFRPSAINWDLDKLWHVLQEQNLVDAKILARLKQEIEWRRTHDFNYDELAQVREKQLFDALKGYTDTLNAATNPGVFQGVIAGVVFARDGKSIQTHLEEILEALVQERENINLKADKSYVDRQLDLKANQDTTYSKTEVDSALLAVAAGHKAYTTLALAQAAQGTLPVNTIVEVTNDPTASNNGTYQWNGTTLTKSAFDPLEQAKADATAKAEAAKNAAIADAATDATTKANAAETNAILAAQNTDVNLLLSLQQIVQTISDNRIELDALIATNMTAINSLQASTALEDNDINTRITRLLLSLQQVMQIIGENRDEVDVLFANLTTTSTFNENAISKLFVSIQTFVGAFNDFINETDRFFDEDEKLKRSYINQQIYVELMKLQNFDPEVVGSNKYVESESIVFLPVPSNVIRIDIETSDPLPVDKGTVINTTTSINVDGQILKNFSTLEVQGSSSVGFPKKNWTLALFADAARTSAIEIKLGHMMPHDELVWKANLVDNTQSRNLAVNRLWDQMLLARSGFPKREVDYVNMVGGMGLNYTPTGALGHVDGFQAVVYINKEFYGIGSLNIGKKRSNYNLASNNQKQIQLEPQGNVNYTAMPSSPTNADSGLEIRRPSTWGLEAQGYYERLISWMAKSRQDMEADGIDNFFNRKNLIDYIILVQVCDLWDHMGKNAEITTWDGQIWNFLPYDCDTVFGLWWTGTIINPATGNEWRPAANLLITQNTSEGPVGFFSKCRRIYGTDIDARYAELRHKKIIDVENITSICSELLRKFPQKLLKAEDTKWNTGGSNSYSGLVQSSSIYQINTWLTVRIAAVDAYFNYTA